MRKLIFVLTVVLSGCYSFKGSSIPAEMKTVYIQPFENVSQLVVPRLAPDLTEAFKERIRTQSRLNLITASSADGTFEGQITDYTIAPISIQDNARPVAGANRLTITVRVKYTNKIKGHEKESFDYQPFTAFTDFSLAGQTLQAQEKALIDKVTIQLTENIFNRAFAQW